ncbi:MAG: hypothetical protein LBI89_03120 [Prevotellaceae bacterium]|nr:hypothetical protein [Prevotellaceae bacterium]
MSYHFNATVSESGYIPIPSCHDLINKQVAVTVNPFSIHRSTKERLAAFFAQTSRIEHSGSATELSWGKPAGKEVW